MKAAAEAMSRVATAAGFRLREQRHVLARAAVEAALPHLAAELAASTLTQSTPLAEYRAQVEAALRERIAAEIRAMPGRPDELPDTELAEQMAVKVFASTKDELFCGDIGWRAARTVAARIAEGGERRGE